MGGEGRVMGILLVLLVVTLANGKEEEEEQKLPRPSVVRGKALTFPPTID